MFRLETFYPVSEFFDADQLLEGMGVDRVVANGDRPEVFGGVSGVELLQQGALFG